MSGDRTDPPGLHLAHAGGPGGADGAHPPALWFAPADPMFSLLIDARGGRLLFELDEGEAAAVLLAWWEHHRARWLDWKAAELRRQRLALVPAAPAS